MANLKCAIGVLISIVIILIAIIAFETWKITELSALPESATTIVPITTPSPSSPSPSSPSSSSPPNPTTHSPPPPTEMQFLLANLTEISVLHIWLKAAEKNKQARFYARQNNEREQQLLLSTFDSDWFNFWEIALNREGQVEFSWAPSETVLSYVYAFEPEKVLDQGIRPLYISPQARRPDRSGSFHLRPPLGWNNDPNGFSRAADGRYHLFYQHYPHDLKWNAMHWGHATSRDLVNWIHQPIFLRPERDEEGRVAHVYSGSAHAFDDGGLMLFYTDHMEGRAITEFQKSVYTKDFYRPMGPARTIIPNTPQNQFAWDFRDPKVFMGPTGAENAFFMTLGSGWANRTRGGLVLLYRQKIVGKQPAAFDQWEYQGILHEEGRWGTDVCECASMIPLQNPAHEDTLFALNYGMQHSRDMDGRTSLSPIIVGTFDGKKFQPMFEQMLDFAADSYAYQPYYEAKAGEALVIGWLGNHWDGKSKLDSQITLPRTMKLSIDRKYLMTAPHQNLLNLREKELNVSGLMEEGGRLELPERGSAEVEYKMVEEGKEVILAMEHSTLGDDAIRVKLDKEGLEIVTKWDNVAADGWRRIARGANPSTLRLFIDQDSLEVFGDNGRWAGTTRIPVEGRVLSIGFAAGTLNRLKSVQAWALKSTQKSIMPTQF